MGKPVNKYPHTHNYKPDNLRAVQGLNSAVHRLWDNCKWLTKIHHEDLDKLLSQIRDLCGEIERMIGELSEATYSYTSNIYEWINDTAANLESLTDSFIEFTAENGSVIECIEENLLKHKNRLDDLEDRVTVIEGQIVDIYNQLTEICDQLTDIRNEISRIWNYLEQLLRSTSGFNKVKLSSGVINANAYSKLYDPTASTDVDDMISAFVPSNTGIMTVTPNGFFATASEDNFNKTILRRSVSSQYGRYNDDGSASIQDNAYFGTILGEVSPETGECSIQIENSNDTTVSDVPSYYFGNYYAKPCNAGTSDLFPVLAHGDDTNPRSIWLLIYIGTGDAISDYYNILSKDDCILSISQGGVTTWNMGYRNGTIDEDSQLSETFPSRENSPSTWGVDHRVTRHLLASNNKVVLAFHCNSINDGFNTQFDSWPNYEGKTGYLGCNNTWAFNITINAFSASARDEANA